MVVLQADSPACLFSSSLLSGYSAATDLKGTSTFSLQKNTVNIECGRLFRLFNFEAFITNSTCWKRMPYLSF